MRKAVDGKPLLNELPLAARADMLIEGGAQLC